MSNRDNKPQVNWPWPVVLFLVSALLGGAACIPAGSIQAVADLFASDGHADFVRPAVLTVFRASMALGALLAFLAGALCWRWRSAVAGFLNARVSVLARAPFVFCEELGAGAVALVRDTPRSHLAALAAIICAGVALRIHYIFAIPLRNDEAHTIVHYVLVPWRQTLTDYTYLNNHLLNSFLMHVSSLVFGGELWALRLPAALASMLMCPALYLVARMLYGKDAALLAVAILAGSSYMIEFGCIARGYSLLSLSFLLLFLAAGYIAEHRQAFGVPVFSVIAALGFYANPTMQFPFAVVFFWLLFRGLAKEDRTEKWRVTRDLVLATAVAGALTIMLYAPVIYCTGLDNITGNRMVNLRRYTGAEYWMEWRSNLRDLVRLTNRAVPLPISILLVVGFCVSLAVPRRFWARRGPVHWAAALAIFVLVWAQDILIPPKGWVWFVPIYFAMGSAGIVYMCKGLFARWRHGAAVVAVIAVILCAWMGCTVLAGKSIETSDRDLWIADPDQVADYLKSVLRPSDKVIIVCPSDKIMYYYSMRKGIPLDHYVATDEPNTAYIVVNELVHDLDQTLQAYQEMVYELDLPHRAVAPPELVKRVSSSAIYRIELRAAS